ncbi:MAG: hypothetical protein LBL65_06630 [Campylobacteraceae bacterium]|nr:hypothetical protein [Campylobacteraceae bacterium]
MSKIVVFIAFIKTAAFLSFSSVVMILRYTQRWFERADIELKVLHVLKEHSAYSLDNLFCQNSNASLKSTGATLLSGFIKNDFDDRKQIKFVKVEADEFLVTHRFY